MLGLGEHVGGEESRIAIGGDDENLGGAGDEVDADFAGEEFLGGRDIDVAGSDDAVGSGHGCGAVGEGRDGLRAAHLEYLRHLEQVSRSEDLIHGARAEQAQMFVTPATCAGTTVMMSVEGSG